MDQQNPQPRNRRADRHRERADSLPPQATRRAGFPPEDEAPLPLGGLDAARPTPRNIPPAPVRPGPATPPAPRVPARHAPQRVYADDEYRAPAGNTRDFAIPRYDDSYDDDEPYRRRWPWVLLILLVLVIGVAAAAWFLPDTSTGFLGMARGAVHNVADKALALFGVKKDEPPRLLNFTIPGETVLAGVQTVFTFTASEGIDGVRVLNEVDEEISGVASSQNAPDNTVWLLRAVMDTPMTATLRAEIRQGETWYATDKTLMLTVAELTPVPLPPTSVPTIAVTPAPTPVVTPVPTVIPTAVPTASPTPVLTVPPTAQPTQAAASVTVNPIPTAIPTAVPTAVPGEAQAAVVTQPPIPTATSSIAFLLPAFTPIPQAGLATATPEAPAALEPEVTAQITPGPEAETAPEAEDAEAAAEAGVGEAPDEPAAKPTPLPTPTMMPSLTAQAAPGAETGNLNITESAYQGSKRVADYRREEPINAQGGLGYMSYDAGVLTFRGDAMRRNAAFGSPDMPLDQMAVKWQSPIGSLRTDDSGTLYGTGWTGQPAIVKWAREIRKAMNLSEAAKAKGDPPLKEVIFAAQDGNIYFLDYEDGTPTREPIKVGYPLKGSVSLDTNARPMLAVGQGISRVGGRQGPIGLYLFNLLDQSQLMFLNGRQTDDQVQYSTNGAFDGTALFDRNSDTMVVAGENGLLYTVDLNTAFHYLQPDVLSVDPKVTYLRGKTERQDGASVSVEASVAMYGPYAYYADRQGILRCVDTTAMKTVWAFDTGDNTDATVALDLENGTDLALYTGTTVFTRSRRAGSAVIRRMDAMTGEVEWAKEVPAKYADGERAGAKASPVVGDGAISDLVIFTVNGTPEGATVLALSKQTGVTVWTCAIPGGAISSPVAVYTTDGRARVVQAGLDGTLYLLDGVTGRMLDTLELGGTIEGSPAAYKDILCVSTSSRDNSFMYAIHLQ